MSLCDRITLETQRSRGRRFGGGSSAIVCVASWFSSWFPTDKYRVFVLILRSVKCSSLRLRFASGKTMKNSCKWKINAHKPKIMPWASRQAARAQRGRAAVHCARQNRNTFHAVLPVCVLLSHTPNPSQHIPYHSSLLPLSVRHEFSINYAKMFVVFALFLLRLRVLWLQQQRFTRCFIQICVHFLFAK